MADQPTQPPAQLLLFRFGPESDFEGQLVGALERIESGGALRVLDALFVGRDAETGELLAIDLGGHRAGGAVASLLMFRLDAAERRRATERTLARGGVPADAMRELGEGLEPGAAMAAVLVEHVWARALDTAVSRIGGTPVANRFVDATQLADLTPELLAASRRDFD